MQEPLVVVQIVTWNSMPYLRFCLESLAKQTYKNVSTLIIDNASYDGTLEFLATSYPHIPIIKNATNRGFAAAHNQGIRNTLSLRRRGQGEVYILVLNPDIILTPTYIEEAVKVMYAHPKAAGITGQLLRYRLENGKAITTCTIDSEGLELLPWRAVRERHAGRIAPATSYQLPPTSYSHVWGISGACALYRLSALENVKIENEYFDEDFFCYKEDVDLSWRMRTRGWKFIYTPCAQAFHKRGIGKEKLHTQRPELINQWSYRNHFYTLLKNEPILDFVLHAPLILGYEFGKFCYYLITQPKTLLVWKDICKNFKIMLKKRHSIYSDFRPSSATLA